nr:pentatricopeptide repeat-containing protein At5g15300 [Ipomoea batatas]GMC73539.1 pentatricopeptide repeat-containing protein At5g15300 [Ipomoea batatas]
MTIKAITNGSSNYQQPSTPWRRIRSCKDFRTLKRIHARIIVNGFNSDRSALRELVYVSAVALSTAIHYAHKLFDQIPEPDIFMWNTMLRGSAQSPRPSLAVSLYARMERHYVCPDNYTFPFVLKACTRLSWVNTGLITHGKIVKHGFESNKFARNSLINFHSNCGDIRIAHWLFDGLAMRDVVAWSALTAGYARRGELEVARRVFDEMPMRDLVSWNVMITGYVKQGKMESARELFDAVPRRDVVTWNTVISGYVHCGERKKALEMYEEMRKAGEQADEATMLSLLSACTDSGSLDVGEKIHSSIMKIMGAGGLSVFLGNALIDMYSRCGSIKKAFEVFHSMSEKDVSTWNLMIRGQAINGHSEESILLFEEMRRMKFIIPNEVTFIGVLVACSHSGKVDKGREYFNLMRAEYSIEPNIRHYGCMVDMLARAGLLNEAFEFIDAMEIEPNAIVWRTVLGACKIHCNVELGRIANAQLSNLGLGESGDYVLLSNIYASRGEWDGVERVRNKMDDCGVWKKPGCSLIEADEEAFLNFLFDSEPQTNPQEHG